MKHDPYYKYLAAALFAGVVLAIIDPTPVLDQPDQVPVAVSSAAAPSVSAKG